MGDKRSGQALLIILLIMAVVLTVGLSLISRSITDIRISQQEEESARAFSAAEAGLEKALLSGGGDYEIGDITASVVETPQGGGALFNFGGDKLPEGDIQTVWLIEHVGEELIGASFPADESITVCWGDDPEEKTAVEVSLFYKSGGEFKVARGAFDPDATRLAVNSFDEADDFDGGNCGDLNLAFAEEINLGDDFGVPAEATLYALRLKLVYNHLYDNKDEPLAVAAVGANFPSQGSCYQSTASVGEGEEKITRRVQQCQFYQAPPDIFDYVLFSGDGL